MSPPWTLDYAPLGGGGPSSGSPAAPPVSAFLGPPGYAGRKAVMWAFKLGAFLRGIFDDYFSRPDLDLERRRREWHAAFVDAYLKLSWEVSSQAFDRLAGGYASHGQIPPLTHAAHMELRGMLKEAGQRAVERMERIEWIKRELAKPPGSPYEPTEADRKQWEKGNPRASEIAELEAEMQADLDRIMQFETSPANWKLTDEQLALMPPEWQERFDRKQSLEASIEEIYGGPAPPDSTLAVALAECKAEMAREAQSLYESEGQE